MGYVKLPMRNALKVQKGKPSMKKNSRKERRGSTAGPKKPKACDPTKVTPEGEAQEAEAERYWIGLDLGDQVSVYCVLDGGQR